MPWWSFVRRSRKPKGPPLRPLPERIAIRDGGFDYENTPYMFVYKEDGPAARVLRVLLSGNRPLRGYEADFIDPNRMAAHEYRAFRLQLLQIIDAGVKEGAISGLENPLVAIHRNYVRITQPFESTTQDIFSEDVVERVLAIVQSAAGFSEPPRVRHDVDKGTYDLLHKQAPGRWRPGS